VLSLIQPSDFVTVGLLVALEGLLSADNALVIAVMVLGLPKARHSQALHYGLIGAFAFRVVATILAVYLIQVGWVKLLGGLYLLYLSYSHFSGGSSSEGRRTPPIAKPWLGLSAFWATVVRVELVNLAFSIDSILVAVAVSPKMWVVMTGGILGIVAMRLVVGQLLALIQRYPALVDGAFGIQLQETANTHPARYRFSWTSAFTGVDTSRAPDDRSPCDRGCPADTAR